MSALRLHGNVVRIEADKTSFGKLLEHGDEIVKTLKDLGFVYITMDLEGFRSGSMDVGLDNNRSRHIGCMNSKRTAE